MLHVSALNILSSELVWKIAEIIKRILRIKTRNSRYLLSTDFIKKLHLTIKKADPFYLHTTTKIGKIFVGETAYQYLLGLTK